MTNYNSNKSKVLAALKPGPNDVDKLVEETGLTESAVLNAIRNLQHQDKKPVSFRHVTYVHFGDD